jgi:hypothetical protein
VATAYTGDAVMLVAVLVLIVAPEAAARRTARANTQVPPTTMSMH